MVATVFSDPLFLEHDTGPHPECAGRIESIEAVLASDIELASRLRRQRPGPASDEAILACHREAHLERVVASSGQSGCFDADTIYSPRSADAARFAAGAAVVAVDAALSSGAASFALVRPPGHHACPDRVMGFCLFNNAAIAARNAQQKGMAKVLIVDYDVHHGNGTQDIFYDDGSVFYYSLHLHPHYPGTGMEEERGRGDGDGTTLNRPLPAGYSADRYRDLYCRDLDDILPSFRPDFAILSAGFDSHRRDPLGGLTLESEDFWYLTKALVDRMPAGRVISTLEGGYNLDVLGDAVRCHLRALAGLGCSPDN